MRIVVAGASGLIGAPLKRQLREAGHQVDVLVRHETSEPGTDRWDPAAGRVDPQFLAGADVLICLSGVNVGRRWTQSYKQQIVQSRVDSVGTLSRSLAEHGGPRRFVVASAVGYYGDTGDRRIDESAPNGDDFLAGVCQLWEDAARPAVEAGVSVAHLRTGLVLAKGGGLLKPLSLVVKAGIGGKLGSGKQYMPWISLTDELAAIGFLVEHPEITGPVNLTGPEPVTNAELTKALGTVLHRPTVFPVPAFAAKIALGEFAWNTLTGQRAVPQVLLDAGFTFAHADIETALRAELGR
ncbi:epimerase [Jatrophihabitans fulvus]